MTRINKLKISSIPMWSAKRTNSNYKRLDILVKLKLEEKECAKVLIKDFSGGINDEKKIDA